MSLKMKKPCRLTTTTNLETIRKEYYKRRGNLRLALKQPEKFLLGELPEATVEKFLSIKLARSAGRSSRSLINELKGHPIMRFIPFDEHMRIFRISLRIASKKKKLQATVKRKILKRDV